MLCGEDTHQHVQQKIALPPRNKPGAKQALSIPAMEAPQYLCESSKYSLGLIKRKFRDHQVSIQSFFMPVTISLALKCTVTPQQRLKYIQSFRATSSLALECVKAESESFS